MSLFTSSYEKYLWLWVCGVIAAIFSTLFIGQPLLKLFDNQNVRVVIFVLGMILIGIAIIMHAIKTKPSKIELSSILGLVAVYVLLILRLGMPERSHLMEYSVLAILIHKAIRERGSQGKHIFMPPLTSFMITFLIGILDEFIQVFLPNRVFDPADIVFNGSVAAMAIGSSVVIVRIRKRAN